VPGIQHSVKNAPIAQYFNLCPPVEAEKMRHEFDTAKKMRQKCKNGTCMALIEIGLHNNTTSTHQLVLDPSTHLRGGL